MDNEPPLNLVRLFDINEEGKATCNQEVLDSLCQQIGDNPLAVISIAGKFRLGKTFSNNILLNGLENGRVRLKTGDVIGGPGQIEFQGGYDRHTKGIMVWPKVFERVDKNGKKLAVILMDTQGTFDTCTDMGDSAIIFAISLLMSSMKIFNTHRHVDAQDLDALNTFIAFSQRSDEPPGQHFLIMVRDSIEKGLNNEYLGQLRANARQSTQLLGLLNGIYEAFNKVDCFMIPRPAEPVLNASTQIFVEECGEQFLETLGECVDYVLDNLTAKIVMGTPLTGKTLGAYVQSLVEHIHSNSPMAMCSAYAATAQLCESRAITEGNDRFDSLHQQLIRENQHRPIKPNDYEESLQKILVECLQIYLSHPSFGSTQDKERRFEDFKKKLKDRCEDKILNNRDRYREIQMKEAINRAYKHYETLMKPDLAQSLSKSQNLELVEENHKKAFQEAIIHFDQGVLDFVEETEMIDLNRKLLIDMMMAYLEDVQDKNVISEIKIQAESLFSGLIAEYQAILDQEVDKTTEEEIDAVIERCRPLLTERYTSRQLAFILEMKSKLPKIDIGIIEQMLNYYLQDKSSQFKKCEEVFEKEVRQQMNVKLLKTETRRLTKEQEESKKKFEQLRATTSAKIEELEQRAITAQRERNEAEDKKIMVSAMSEMARALNERMDKHMERVIEERKESDRLLILAQQEEDRRRAEELERERQANIEHNRIELEARIERERDQRQIQAQSQAFVHEQEMARLAVLERAQEEPPRDEQNIQDVLMTVVGTAAATILPKLITRL